MIQRKDFHPLPSTGLIDITINPKYHSNPNTIFNCNPKSNSNSKPNPDPKPNLDSKPNPNLKSTPNPNPKVKIRGEHDILPYSITQL